MAGRAFDAHPLMRDGFTAIPNVLLRSRMISGQAKILYALILDVVQYQRAEPTMQDLGDLMGCGVKVVRGAMAELVAAGYATSRRRGQGLPNQITLTIPEPQSDQNGQSGSSETADPSLLLKTSVKKDPSGELALAQEGPSPLVAYFVDESTRLHSKPPRRVTGQVARLISEMLAEGVVPDRVRAGIDLLLLKRLHPSTLPSLVHEAGLPRRPQERRDDGMFSPEAMMADAVRDAREGR